MQLKLQKCWVFLAVFSLVASEAVAGYKRTFEGPPAGVDTTNRIAYGAFGDARNSANANHRAGCSMYSSTSGNTWVWCYATDANGVSAGCYSDSYTPAFADVEAAVRFLQPDSFLYFTWDAAGYCAQVYVGNYSYWAPKNP